MEQKQDEEQVLITAELIEELQQFALHIINESRGKIELQEIRINDAASEAANEHCQEMVREKFTSCWNTSCEKPYQRYTRFNVQHCVTESIYGIDAADGASLQFSSKEELQNMITTAHQSFLDSANVADLENVNSWKHTEIGIGLHFSAERFRFIEAYVDRYVEMAEESWNIDGNSSSPHDITGAVLFPSFGIAGCSIYRDVKSKNNIQSVEEIKTCMDSVLLPEREESRIVLIKPWEIQVTEDQGFVISMPIRAGILEVLDEEEVAASENGNVPVDVVVEIIVHQDPAAIPYAQPLPMFLMDNDKSVRCIRHVVTVNVSTNPALVSCDEKRGNSGSEMISNLPDAITQFFFQSRKTVEEDWPPAALSSEYDMIPVDTSNVHIQAGCVRHMDYDVQGVEVYTDVKRCNAAMDDVEDQEGYHLIDLDFGAILTSTATNNTVIESKEPQPFWLCGRKQTYKSIVVDSSENGKARVISSMVIELLSASEEISMEPIEQEYSKVFFVQLSSGEKLRLEFCYSPVSTFAASTLDIESTQANVAGENGRPEVDEDDVESEIGDDEADNDEQHDEHDEETRQEQWENSEIERLTKLLEDSNVHKEQLFGANSNLQKQLVPLLNKRDSKDRKEDKMNSVENEKRYLDCLHSVHEAHVQLQKSQTQYDRVAMDLQSRLDEKEYKATEIHQSFLEFKREIAKGAENSRTGKLIPPRLITQFETAEAKKDQEVEKVRLKNINLRTHLRKLEQQLRAKEQLAEGLHLIDFEQLKIENQTLNEKIEERNEELHKLRKKTTTTVQVLTHIKEKLQFIAVENQELKRQLGILDEELTVERDALSKTKKDRDRLRNDNGNMKKKQGFINCDRLVFDFEQRKTNLDIKGARLTQLKQRYAFLTQGISEFKSNQINSHQAHTLVPR